MLVAHHAAGEMFAGELAALEVERVAVGVVGRRAEHADMTVVLRPSHLPVVGNVAPQEIAALRAPGRTFGPQHAGIETLDRGVGLGDVVERRIDRDDVGIPEIGGRRAARAEIARRTGDRRRRADRGRGSLGQRAAGRHGGAGDRRHTLHQRAPRNHDVWIALLFACHRILPIVHRPLIRPGNLRLNRSVPGCENCFEFCSRRSVAAQDGVTSSTMAGRRRATKLSSPGEGG